VQLNIPSRQDLDSELSVDSRSETGPHALCVCYQLQVASTADELRPNLAS
jgi:hypothetical protein